MKAALAQAMEALGAGAARSLPFFQHGTLQVKLYAPRGSDLQTPHARDESYVVAAGAGEFMLAGERTSFARGDFLFAPAGVEHRFESFGGDFFTWVLFHGPEGGEAAGRSPP